MTSREFWQGLILGVMEILVIGILGYAKVLQSEAIVGLLTASIAIRGKSMASGGAGAPPGAAPVRRAGAGLATAGLLGVALALGGRVAQRSRPDLRPAAVLVTAVLLAAACAPNFPVRPAWPVLPSRGLR